MSITGRLESMLAQGRDDAMIRFGLGSAYFNDGDDAAAVEHLEACISHDGEYSAAYKLLGKAYYRLQALDEAHRILTTGISIAAAQGDKQSEREMQVFLNKTNEARG